MEIIIKKHATYLNKALFIEFTNMWRKVHSKILLCTSMLRILSEISVYIQKILHPNRNLNSILAKVFFFLRSEKSELVLKKWSMAFYSQHHIHRSNSLVILEKNFFSYSSKMPYINILEVFPLLVGIKRQFITKIGFDKHWCQCFL